MCTRANRASVSDSARALVASFVALFLALATLTVAIAATPLRGLRTGSNRYGRPAATGHVEVQVHLDDCGRARAVERSARAALHRAARTWAPHPLPLDRVEIYSTAPPLGRADIFNDWVVEAGGAWARALVVVSIGTSIDGRTLTPDEIAGALAGQIERLVVERYQREHPKTETPARVSEAVRAPERLQPLTSATVTPHDAGPTDNVTDLNTVRALLADIKKSQPLVPAGPFTNGVHLEPDPAS
jgi:hypothetical protein